jgi:hypothetical protein
VKPSVSKSELLNRKRLIDPKLKAAGWSIIPFSPGMSLNSHQRWASQHSYTAFLPAQCGISLANSVIASLSSADNEGYLFWIAGGCPLVHPCYYQQLRPKNHASKSH